MANFFSFLQISEISQLNCLCHDIYGNEMEQIFFSFILWIIIRINISILEIWYFDYLLVILILSLICNFSLCLYLVFFKRFYIFSLFLLWYFIAMGCEVILIWLSSQPILNMMYWYFALDIPNLISLDVRLLVGENSFTLKMFLFKGNFFILNNWSFVGLRQIDKWVILFGQKKTAIKKDLILIW